MLFYTELKSFELISLLDRILVKKKLSYTVLFIIKYMRFKFINKIILSLPLNNKKKIKLFCKLFKEYFYLHEVTNLHNIKPSSNLTYTIINDIIVTDISINNVILHMEMNIHNTQDISIFINHKDSKFNLSEYSLNNKNSKEIFNLILEILNEKIFLDLVKIIIYYIGRIKDV